MTAQQLAASFLAEDLDPEDVVHFSPQVQFKHDASDILVQAADLYERLERAGVLAVLRKEKYDPVAVAEAVLYLAIERSRTHAPGRAYRRIQQLAKSSVL